MNLKVGPKTEDRRPEMEMQQHKDFTEGVGVLRNNHKSEIDKVLVIVTGTVIT